MAFAGGTPTHIGATQPPGNRDVQYQQHDSRACSIDFGLKLQPRSLVSVGSALPLADGSELASVSQRCRGEGETKRDGAEPCAFTRNGGGRKPEYLASILEMIHADRTLVFSTDYPHWDNDFPNLTCRNFGGAAAADIFRMLLTSSIWLEARLSTERAVSLHLVAQLDQLEDANLKSSRWRDYRRPHQPTARSTRYATSVLTRGAGVPGHVRERCCRASGYFVFGG